MSEGGAAQMTDMTGPDYTTMRRAMVECQLRPSDVSDPVVIGAMAVALREDFTGDGQAPVAYIDRALSLGGDRFLNPPLSTGLLLSRADISGSDHVLLIGASTGYVATLLGALAGSVVALEEDEALAARARTALAGHDNVEIVTGPLASGHAKGAPYSLIVIDGAVEQLPDALIGQLDDGGRLVTGLVENGVTRLAHGRKRGGSFGLASFVDSDIAPLSAFAKPAGYQF
ncbi:MAG: rRNA adenine N-6-methyltransferase family protein [Blastomonas sp.]